MATVPLLPPAASARDIMQTEVLSVRPEMTIRELVQLLSEQGISGASVLTPTGRIVGVVSTTDVMRFIAHESEIPAGQLSWDPYLLAEEENGADASGASYYFAPDTAARFSAPALDSSAASSLDAYTVAEIMTPVAFSVQPADSISELVDLFLRGRIHRVLVVEREMLLGIITPFDMLRCVVGAEPREEE